MKLFGGTQQQPRTLRIRDLFVPWIRSGGTLSAVLKGDIQNYTNSIDTFHSVLFVDAARIPTMVASSRSHHSQLGICNHNFVSRIQRLPIFESSSTLSATRTRHQQFASSLLASTRLYSDRAQDKETNHHEQRDPQSRPSPNELSSLAKSVRDKITHLLHSTHDKEPRGVATRIPIVVSVSGGCDSVALFHALVEWNMHLSQAEQRLQLDITVVHFHHRQRPMEADEDCNLVTELVEEHNRNAIESETDTIQFRLEDWKDINDEEKTTNEADSPSSSFSQDKARVWRRNKLLECAKESLKNCSNSAPPFGIVLTAHHDDDSYETVLIKLLRGVHLLNLHDKATISSIAPLEDTANTNSGTKPHQQTESPIYLVRPFVTDPRPLSNNNTASVNTNALPGHTKDELIQYLVDRNLEWREDASNHDPNSKYLRNRVRNELIPLLQDLTEDSFRTKRIPALLEQSHELKQDLQHRVEDYLDNVVQTEESQSYFEILPLDEQNTKLVWSQALYQWMSSCVVDDCRNPWNIPYESHQRVIQQLENHPHHTFWKLELGSGWNVERIGSVLKIQQERDTIDYNHWDWKTVLETEHGNLDELRIHVPSTVFDSLSSSSLQFVSTTLQEAESSMGGVDTEGSSSIRFSPPWKNSSVKLRAFLRGQKVPTHLRENTQLLFLVPNDDIETASRDGNRLVAVCVRDAWIVDKEFYMESSSDVNAREETDSIVLQLERNKEK